MKLRLGFVTNSSSTNYVIAWKGEKRDLFDLVKEHIYLMNSMAYCPECGQSLPPKDQFQIVFQGHSDDEILFKKIVSVKDWFGTLDEYGYDSSNDSSIEKEVKDMDWVYEFLLHDNVDAEIINHKEPNFKWLTEYHKY